MFKFKKEFEDFSLICSQPSSLLVSRHIICHLRCSIGGSVCNIIPRCKADSSPSSLARVTSINSGAELSALALLHWLQLKQGQKFKTDISIESRCWHRGANTDRLKACCCIYVGRDQRMQVQGKRWALLKSRKEILGVSLSTPLGCINFR